MHGTTPYMTGRMLIGGEFVESKSGEWLESINPADESALGRVPMGNAADMADAVAAAEKAQPAWAALTMAQRADYIHKLGDALLADWRQRARKSTARVRAYCDVHPSHDSTLTLDPATKNRWGDPLPKIEHRLYEATLARKDRTRQHVLDVFARLAKAARAVRVPVQPVWRRVLGFVERGQVVGAVHHDARDAA